MERDWNDALIAFLHDPPDKALDIRGHETRACRYLAEALGRTISRSELHGLDDQVASISERLPMPTAGSDGSRAVGVQGGEIQVVHPLGGDRRSLAVNDVNEENVAEAIRGLIGECSTPRARFLTLWRWLPESLSVGAPYFARLPADTRIPDHTIWNHLDTTTALQSAFAAGHGPAFLSFSLGPVQTFIASARSIRDLWSGSMILSWLTFEAMKPVLIDHGPAALVYPALRGIPFLDQWLTKDMDLTRPRMCSASSRQTPCLPNRFLALVPSGVDGDESEQLARRCEKSCQDAWAKLAGAVHEQLAGRWHGYHSDWDRDWESQIQGFFEARTAVLPWRGLTDEALAQLVAGEADFATAFPEASQARGLASAIPREHSPGYSQEMAGNWQAKVELSARLLAAERMIRQAPPREATAPGAKSPPKCSLMGSYEQMGPADLDASRLFWNQVARDSIEGVRLRRRERLCAVSLVKRFAEPVFFRHELQLSRGDCFWPDTATVAAAAWLRKVQALGFDLDPDRISGWSGQWLHWPSQKADDDEDSPADVVWTTIRQAKRHADLGPPPAYYAVLMIDGDDMGRWLQGGNSSRVREVLHPDLLRYFEVLDPAPRESLNARRPVGPTLHAAISEALTNFALHAAPRIVERHFGALIYAGGDDVLALLPVSTAMACAHELRLAFAGDIRVNQGAPDGFYRVEGRDRLMMSSRATASAGLAVVHYKEDLRYALDAARRAEKAAKQAGKDAVQLAACRRSGEHSSALCPWQFVPDLLGWINAFEQSASDRWAYHLRAELPTLHSLPGPAIQAEIRRQVNRSEKWTREKLGQTDGQTAGDILAGQYQRYRELLSARANSNHATGVLANFVTLCQTASFLARGRDA